jgi:hypothetical protein
MDQRHRRRRRRRLRTRIALHQYGSHAAQYGESHQRIDAEGSAPSSVRVLVLPPRAGLGGSGFRRSLEREAEVGRDERVGRGHGVGVVDGSVLGREGGCRFAGASPSTRRTTKAPRTADLTRISDATRRLSRLHSSVPRHLAGFYPCRVSRLEFAHALDGRQAAMRASGVSDVPVVRRTLGKDAMSFRRGAVVLS